MPRGIPNPRAIRPTTQPIPETQEFFEGIGGDVVTGGDRACYIPSLDQNPHAGPEAVRECKRLLLSTLFPRWALGPSARDRLDRSFGVSSFGNEAYSKEELLRRD